MSSRVLALGVALVSQLSLGCSSREVLVLPGLGRSGLATAIVGFESGRIVGGSPLLVHEEGDAVELDLPDDPRVDGIVAYTWTTERLRARFGELPPRAERQAPLSGAVSCAGAFPLPDETATLEGRAPNPLPAISAPWAADRCPANWAEGVRVASDCSLSKCLPAVTALGPCAVSVQLRSCGFAGSMRVTPSDCVVPESEGCDVPTPLVGGGVRLNCNRQCNFWLYDRGPTDWLGPPKRIAFTTQPPSIAEVAPGDPYRSWHRRSGYLGPMALSSGRIFLVSHGDRFVRGRTCLGDASDVLVVLDTNLVELARRPLPGCMSSLVPRDDAPGVQGVTTSSASVDVVNFDLDGRIEGTAQITAGDPSIEPALAIGTADRRGESIVAVTRNPPEGVRFGGRLDFYRVLASPLRVVLFASLADYEGTAFAYDGRFIAVAADNRDTIVLFDPAEGRMTDEQRLPAGPSLGFGQMIWNEAAQTLVVPVPHDLAFVAFVVPPEPTVGAPIVDSASSPLLAGRWPPEPKTTLLAMSTTTNRTPNPSAKLTRVKVDEKRLLPGEIVLGWGMPGDLIVLEDRVIVSLPWAGELVSLAIVR